MVMVWDGNNGKAMMERWGKTCQCHGNVKHRPPI